MIAYCVRYENLQGDVDELLAYYRDHHVPILARWPGVRTVQLLTPVDAHDPCPTTSGTMVLEVLITFDSLGSLQSALGSAERVEARDDFGNFPAFTGRVTHQAVRGEALFEAGP